MNRRISITINNRIVTWAIYVNLLLLGCVLHQDLNEWIYSLCPKLFEKTYELACSSILFNIIIITTIVLLELLIICREKSNKSFFLRYFLFNLFILYQITVNDFWQYAKVINLSITYKDIFVTFIILGLLCFTIIKLYDNNKNRVENQDNQKGFPEGEFEEMKFPEGWDASVNELVKRIKSTNLSEGCYVIGVCGEWGSGKTTYINKVKNGFQEGWEKIDFSPWNYTSTSTLISDYFKALEPYIGGGNRNIENKLKRMVSILTANSDHFNWVNAILSVIHPYTESTLSELYKSINEHIGKQNNRIIVFIDDLDRTNPQELYEFLKLIRSSANFRNTVIIATYDKGHVVDMLSKMDIKSGENYIKKIFQIEIALPGYEKEIIPELLLKEIKRLLPDKEDQLEILNNCIYKYDKEYDYFILNNSSLIL